MAKRYIDADALYEQTAEWEARALAVVEKLNSKPLGEMDVNEITEWRKWSCVLNERSAFKHDVADAPTANVVDKERYDRLLENSTIISEALNKYQSADMVEVVRCKDCKYFDMSDIAGTIEPICYRCKRFARTYRYAEDFCSYGERKETEDEEK